MANVIGLDMEMPMKCLDCPCLWTIVCPKVEDGTNVCIRFCAAKHKEIYVCPQKESMPDEWMSFNKPDFCPWVQLSIAKEMRALWKN